MAKKKVTAKKNEQKKKSPARKEARASSTTRAKKATKKAGAAKKTGKAASKKRVASPRKTKEAKPRASGAKRRKTVKTPLVYAPDWQIFYAVNGAVLRSLYDLYKELETMLEEEYAYHKEGGDHFSIWVREVLCDEKCAEALTKATTKRKARTVIKRHLAFYEI